MGYHDLSECTLTSDERLVEVGRILEMFGIGALNIDECSQKEKDFIYSLQSSTSVSVKQLFWLRDIKDRIL